MESQEELSFELESVRRKIAEVIHEQMDIPAENVLQDIPFPDLHKDFDSLSMMEIQLLLEKAYGFEFQIDMHDRTKKLPVNVTELAEELIRQHTRHVAQVAAKAQAKLLLAQANKS